MLAGSEYREGAVVAGDGRAAGSGLTLVARHGRVAKIHAARSLKQVAGGGGHVAELSRSAGENGLRKNRIIALHSGMIGQIRIAYGGADLKAAVGKVFDFVEGEP